MNNPLNIFISSTMNDLANERLAVVQAINNIKFNPINAENWTPNGMNSWNKISSEIGNSDIFILLLGESYGWVPNTGYGSDKKLSVTHLEYQLGKELEIPILPFFKKLNYSSPRHTKDAKKRDKFRNEVAEWSTGKFRGEFNLASDLSEIVTTSILSFLAENFKKGAIKAPLKSCLLYHVYH